MYLFQRRPQTLDEARSDAEASELSGASSFPPFHDVLPSLNTPALQPGSAAEWAIGELLIRLCNGGRSLGRESPEPSATE
jgi:hypothetical protein